MEEAPPTTSEAINEVADKVTDFFAHITDATDVTSDVRADLIVKFEEVETLVDESKKLVATYAETE